MTGPLAPPRRVVPLARLLALELRTELCRRRTALTLAVLALVPLVIGVGVAARGPVDGAGTPGSGLIVAVTGNGLMLPVTALAVALSLLLPLGVAIAAADALAGEAANGTLRGLLLAPVSRAGLVGIKACGVLALAALEVVAVTAVALVVGLTALGGAGGLLTLSGTTVGSGAALARVGLAAGWTALQVAAVGAVALAVSALTDRPVVVLASVLGGAVVFDMLDDVPALDWLRPALLTSDWSAVTDLARDPMPTGTLARGALLAVCYLVAGLAVAVLGTQYREA